MLEISNGIYSIKRCKKVIPGTKEKLYKCLNKKLQKAQINPNITNAGDSGVSENTRCGEQNSFETTNPNPKNRTGCQTTKHNQNNNQCNIKTIVRKITTRNSHQYWWHNTHCGEQTYLAYFMYPNPPPSFLITRRGAGFIKKIRNQNSEFLIFIYDDFVIILLIHQRL